MTLKLQPVRVATWGSGGTVFFENGYGRLDRQAHPIFANLVAAKDYIVKRLERAA